LTIPIVTTLLREILSQIAAYPETRRQLFSCLRIATGQTVAYISVLVHVSVATVNSGGKRKHQIVHVHTLLNVYDLLSRQTPEYVNCQLGVRLLRWEDETLHNCCQLELQWSFSFHLDCILLIQLVQWMCWFRFPFPWTWFKIATASMTPTMSMRLVKCRFIIIIIIIVIIIYHLRQSYTPREHITNSLDVPVNQSFLNAVCLMHIRELHALTVQLSAWHNKHVLTPRALRPFTPRRSSYMSDRCRDCRSFVTPFWFLFRRTLNFSRSCAR